MPKQSSKAEINNFIQGFMTEASPLNFPPNATADEQNFEVDRKGIRRRRNGMRFEADYQLRPLQTFTEKMSSFNWTSVGGNPSANFVVVHSYDTLQFYDRDQQKTSRDGYLGSLVIPELLVASNRQSVNMIGPTAPSVNVAWSFAAIDGRLVVTSGSELICIVSHTESGFSYETSRIKVRDLWGVSPKGTPEGEDLAFRPTTLSHIHNYNLQNQSWGIPRRAETLTIITTILEQFGVGEPPTIVYVPVTREEKVISSLNPIEKYKTDLGVYPSHSESVWAGIQFQPVDVAATPFERIYTNLYNEALGADNRAAKGYFLIDLLRRGISRQSALGANVSKFPEMAFSGPDLPADTSPSGAKVVHPFAGRIFYGGFEGTVLSGDDKSPNLSNMIFFSQLVKSISDIPNCYQLGDPTSRENNDIVDTDGGFIKLSGVEGVLGFADIGSSLLVIATNGVWAVKGGGDLGFGASNYKSEKLSVYGGISRSSIVSDGSRVLYWGKSGIFVIEKDQFGELKVNNITEKTIQSFYEAIPNSSKTLSKGVYSPLDKTIRWIFRDGSFFSADSEMSELVLHTGIPAFTKNKIFSPPGYNVELVGVFSSTDFTTSQEELEVVVSDVPVVASGEAVVFQASGRLSAIQSARYTVVVKDGANYSLTFASYRDTDFLDWRDISGVDAEGFMITGAQTGGDSALAKQVPYLSMHFLKTEIEIDNDGVPTQQSGCQVRTTWDWAVNTKTLKFGPPFQAYRHRLGIFTEADFDTGFSIVTTRNKIRGRGKAFAMHIRTEPEKDCQLLGWNLAINGNQFT